MNFYIWKYDSNFRGFIQMITATQAVEISNTNADQIEKVLDQKSEFWKKVKNELDKAMHNGKRVASILLEPSDDLENIYTVLRYNGYKLTFSRLFHGDYMHPGTIETIQADVILKPNDFVGNDLYYPGDLFVEVSW